jgi:hypothetical protein
MWTTGSILGIKFFNKGPRRAKITPEKARYDKVVLTMNETELRVNRLITNQIEGFGLVTTKANHHSWDI